jgi:hypothetical protein
LKHFLSNLSGFIRELIAISEVLISMVACATMKVIAALSYPSSHNNKEKEIKVSIRGIVAGVEMWARWRTIVAALVSFDGKVV